MKRSVIDKQLMKIKQMDSDSKKTDLLLE